MAGNSCTASPGGSGLGRTVPALKGRLSSYESLYCGWWGSPFNKALLQYINNILKAVCYGGKSYRFYVAFSFRGVWMTILYISAENVYQGMSNVYIVIALGEDGV